MLKVPKFSKNRTRETAMEMGSSSEPVDSPRHRSVSSSRLRDADMDEFKPVAFYCLRRESRPRVWFINLMCSPYPFLKSTLYTHALRLTARRFRALVHVMLYACVYEIAFVHEKINAVSFVGEPLYHIDQDTESSLIILVLE